jgi:spermidine synthase
MWLVPLIGDAYRFIGSGSVLMRALIAMACLLPPTMLMGASLPSVARWVETTPTGVSWLGYFYGGNIGGAVVGSLVTGFYLLRVYDTSIATYVAASLNMAVAMVAFFMASRLPDAPRTISPVVERPTTSGAVIVYIVAALSGATALGAQVIWTRLLSLSFGGTVYAFSLILGAILFGLGLGAWIGAAFARTTTLPRVALGWIQMLLCGAIAWAGSRLTTSLPYWPISPQISSSPWFTFELDVVVSLWVVLPASILWGASVPLALASVSRAGSDPARFVGRVYAANTFGAIAGSLLTGLVFVSSIGTRNVQQLLIALSALAGAMLLVPRALTARPAHRMTAAGAVVAVVGAIWLIRTVSDIPALLVQYGRYSAFTQAWVGRTDAVYVGEGLNGFVAVSRNAKGQLYYHNAGKVQASSEPQDMRLQRMLGHFTHLVPSAPKDVLVIGLGAGVTAGAVSIGPGVERMTIVEIEPLVPQVVSTYFADYNDHVLQNPKVRVFVDDGRHFLQTTDARFDAITTDPFDPWAKGSAVLLTREFFELAKQRLNPGGVVTLWVPLYENSTAAVKSAIATFFDAFPHAVIWGNTNNGQGYDIVLMGQAGPPRIDVDDLQRRLDSPPFVQVKRSLSAIGISSAVDLVKGYAGSPRDLANWLKDADINRDRGLKLQYLAGMGLNLFESGAIYADMLAHVRFPEELYVASPATRQSLREAMNRAVTEGLAAGQDKGNTLP